MDSKVVTFNEEEWRKTCERLSSSAMKGCGCSFEFYVESFSEVIDTEAAVYSEEDRVKAIEIANEWEYITPEQRAEQQKWNKENGCCIHGIELGYCPAGCGS